MNKDRPEPGKYVQKVHQETQEFIQSLLAENSELRELTARLESAKAGLADQAANLQEELAALKLDLDRRRDGEARLEEELAQAEAKSRRYSSEYVEVARQSSSLANLYVASYRLHGTLGREEVLNALEEIIVNLIGSEEFAIFECGPSAGTLELVASFGVEPSQLEAHTTGSGLIAECARTGELYASERATNQAEGHDESTLTACVPLKLEERVLGVIAIFRLLAHKPELAALDLDLFDLLATQAASALYLTRLHAASGAAFEATE